MTEREKIIERLRMVPTTDGGSHENLSAICRTIYNPVTGWTREACEILRATLIRLLGDTDSETSDGKRITDELRGWFDRYTMRKDVYDELLAIADRIDAAHEKAIASVMNDALYHANDKDMADLGWVRLPEDADGECIHVGDELRDEWHEQNQGEVEWLMLDHHGWWLMLKNSCERFYVHEFHEWRHHHAPTVEDVLHEFICDHEEGVRDEVDLIAEYAAKLRLAGGDE